MVADWGIVGKASCCKASSSGAALSGEMPSASGKVGAAGLSEFNVDVVEDLGDKPNISLSSAKTSDFDGPLAKGPAFSAALGLRKGLPKRADTWSRASASDFSSIGGGTLKGGDGAAGCGPKRAEGADLDEDEEEVQEEDLEDEEDPEESNPVASMERSSIMPRKPSCNSLAAAASAS
jgi:hypothetical protein